MKNKKKILTSLGFIAALCLSFGFVACDSSTSKEKVLSGFEVVEKSVAELGSVYTIPMPLVSDQDRKIYDVDVSVKEGNADGQDVEIIGGMFEITKTTDYVITYTLKANGVTERKVTTLKVEDTQGPAIQMEGIKAKGALGDVIDISSITAEDYSGVEEITAEVKYGTESVTVTDKKFTFDKTGRYVVKAKATDKNGVVSEKNYLTECLAENQIYTFNTEQLGTKFGTRYASLAQISEGPNNAGGCLKLVPTQGWFYMTWASIGFNEKYEYDLTKAIYDEYAYVTADIYFETESTSATIYDFSNKSTAIETNKWVSVTFNKETFNNSSVQAYTPMWSSVPATAVYVDNIRLEKVTPMVYDFEGGNVAGQFASNQGTCSMAVDPENENNNVLKWDVTAQWASLNFNNFNKEHLSSKHYDAYHEVSFRIYVKDETVDKATIGVFLTATDSSIPTNQWVTITRPIKTLVESATAKYVCIWRNNTEGCTVYFDDIQVKTFDGVLYNFDNRGSASTVNGTAGNGGTFTAFVVDNPYVTETNGASKVLKVDARPTICIKFNNLKNDINTWQSITGLEYTRLSFDIYVDVELDGSPTFDGFDTNNDWDSNHGVRYGEWCRLSVDVTDGNIYQQLMMWWNDVAGTVVGSVYLDNFVLYVD